MPISLLPTFLYYCFVSSITPGPANLTSFSTAIRMGKKPAVRQWHGLFTGFCIISLLSVLIIYFIGVNFADYIKYFSFIGAIYMLYLAWHIFSDNFKDHSAPAVPGAKKRAFAEGTFLFGLSVNLSNVKIMVFNLTALGSFVLPYSAGFKNLLTIGCLLPFTGPICNLVWLFAGTKLQVLFSRHRKLINTLMALSLVFCAVSMVV